MTTGSGPAAGEVYRVHWLPGTDLLHGSCHCGAEHTDDDPVEMWGWMLTHEHRHEESHR
ncbi:hypothetical protein [Streptacidiphilus carbonis]|uniref:hypothetical protein n=1 Tax=Streptacidiphilus carbonis TaxID=105422 RepID=UPI000ABE846E|nr:hypothetical protein [Streptacidiphilus carbonis]